MADTDLRDRLDLLARSGADEAHPLPAAEIRRRGRARARRRTAALSSTVAVAAVLTGVVVVGPDRSPARPVAAAPPSTTATAGTDIAGNTLADGQSGISEPVPDTGPPVDPAVLLTTGDLPDPDSYGWTAVEFRTDTPDPTLPCDLGTTAVLDEGLPGVTGAFEAEDGRAGFFQEVRRYPAEASTADAVAALATRLQTCTGAAFTQQSPYGLVARLDGVADGATTSVDVVVAARGTTVVALYTRGSGDQPGQQALTLLMGTALERATG